MPADTQGRGPGPLVSIVTVCLNAEEHIGQAVESVLAQTYQPIEYVVVDGGSSDATLEIVRGYEPRFEGQMRWVSEPDEGLYDAMNKGVGMARGELVGILNADDYYEPDAVMRVVATWQANPEAGVVYGDTRNVDACGNVTLERPAPSSVDLETMMGGMVLCHQSMFVTAESYRRLGGYDMRYRILADYEFVMRAVSSGVSFAYAGANLSFFRLGGASGAAIRELDRERTRIKIDYGASPVAQWALYCKHALATVVYGLLRRSKALERAYQRLRGSGRGSSGS